MSQNYANEVSTLYQASLCSNVCEACSHGVEFLSYFVYKKGEVFDLSGSSGLLPLP